MRDRRVIIGACVALTFAAASVKDAGASFSADHGSAGVAAIPPGALTSTPPGYVVVHSSDSVAVSGTDTLAVVLCPKLNGTARYPLSGGAVIDSLSLQTPLVVSEAANTEWVTYIHNASGASVVFRAWAVCAKRPHGYAQVYSPGLFTAPSGTQVAGSVTCPLGTKVSGGGGEVNTPGGTINTSMPANNGWTLRVNNPTSSPVYFFVAAVCARWPASTFYHAYGGSAVDNPPGTQTQAFAYCPAGQSSLGGGLYSSEGSTLVSLSSSNPIAGGWATAESNASTQDQYIVPYVICAT